MRFPGFVGPSYTNASVNVAAQRTINLFPELVEVEEDKRIVLVGTPGLSEYCDIGEGPVRALAKPNSRVFAIGGSKFVEILPGGTVVPRGNVASDGLPATITSNGKQLFVGSGTRGYIYTFATDMFAEINDADFPGVAQGAFIDGFFIALDPNSQEFFISSLYDGTEWDALDFASAEAAPDDAIALIADHRELWLFGTESAEGFYNSGNADFPFTRIDGSFTEQGCVAAYSVAKLDNAIFWLAGGSQGIGVVSRLQAGPVRISTHAVETAIQSYARVDDAVGYAYQDQGHTFYVLVFPAAGATWVYDVATQLWHERGYWDAVNGGVFQAQRAQCHVYAFGEHLVGDRQTGLVYKQRHDVYTDNGSAIRRVRRAPHIAKENHRVFYSLFEPHFEAGTGLGSGLGSDPQCMLRWSNDGGHAWSAERTVSTGQVGQYTRRAQFWRLGSGPDRVFELSMTDPVRWVLLDAYLEAN